MQIDWNETRILTSTHRRTFGDRSVIGLPIIETVAVFAGCFVYGVESEVRGRIGLRLGEDVA